MARTAPAQKCSRSRYALPAPEKAKSQFSKTNLPLSKMSADDYAQHTSSPDSDKHLTTSRITRLYRCTMCSFTFTRLERLHRHIRLHTGERPFVCHCKETFSRADNLKVHVRSKHRNVPDHLNNAVLKSITQVQADINRRTADNNIDMGYVDVINIIKPSETPRHHEPETSRSDFVDRMALLTSAAYHVSFIDDKALESTLPVDSDFQEPPSLASTPAEHNISATKVVSFGTMTGIAYPSKGRPATKSPDRQGFDFHSTSPPRSPSQAPATVLAPNGLTPGGNGVSRAKSLARHAFETHHKPVVSKACPSLPNQYVKSCIDAVYKASDKYVVNKKHPEANVPVVQTIQRLPSISSLISQTSLTPFHSSSSSFYNVVPLTLINEHPANLRYPLKYAHMQYPTSISTRNSFREVPHSISRSTLASSRHFD